ncbi:unnamed protein product [Lampetra fluviatilis]
MSSSEEVLLLVSHVRYRKQDGSLYLMAGRLAWGARGTHRFTASIDYADIQSQKITPDGRAKVQLQVITHGGEATTFHFTGGPAGGGEQPPPSMGGGGGGAPLPAAVGGGSAAAASRDRDSVKELLQQLLPRFKRRANQELEHKNRLLQQDPVLFLLYKELVVGHVISAEEFWANRIASNGADGPSPSAQTVGVSAAFLADVRPQADGCNGLKYNLTNDIIQSIFTTYPAVREKFVGNVPHAMTEREFWTRFFQSHYFHRDRLSSGSQDIFSECAKQDERGLQEIVDRGVWNPLLDLTAMGDSSLGEGYGSSSPPSTSSAASSARSSSNAIIIRRLNQHSSMVLATNSNSNSRGSVSGEAVKRCGGDAENQQQQQPQQPPTKKKCVEEACRYEDLLEPRPSETVTLNLKRSDRYFHGPVPVLPCPYSTGHEILGAVSATRSQMAAYTPCPQQALSAALTSSAIASLSPGGSLMQGGTQSSSRDMLSVDLQEELLLLYLSLGELLRHFWGCFPLNSPLQQDKVLRVRLSLERFTSSRLLPFNDKLSRNHVSTNVTSHLLEMLEAAYSKLSSWQSRQQHGRQRP